MRILVAEDELVTRRLLARSLEAWGHDAEVVENGDGAWAVLSRDDAPRIALLDWMMPGRSGVDVCRRLRTTNGKPYVYVVLLTSRSARADRLAGLEAGADDYLTKPVDLDELRARLATATRIVQVQDDLVRAREALRVQALHDALTGALNRGAILDALAEELARARRTGQPVGVVLMDIDHFKRVNDTLGHLAGDSVLRESVTRARAVLRPYDRIGRYGGEEFLLALPQCGAAQGVLIAERVRASIADSPVRTAAGDRRVTASLGVASSTFFDGLTPEALVAAADGALYQAKHAGRDRVVLAQGLPLAP